MTYNEIRCLCIDCPLIGQPRWAFSSLWVQMMMHQRNKPACLANWNKGKGEELTIPPKNCPRALEFLVL